MSFPLGNIGLPASGAAAFSAIMLYRDFIFDGGYYPNGGMQNLADKFVEIFIEHGGEILNKTTVDEITLNNKKATGIRFDKQNIFSDYVISNCDAHQTFFKLINPNILTKKFKFKIESGALSISSYILYLGLNVKTEKFIKRCCTLWQFDDFNVNAIYSKAINGKMSMPPKYFLVTFPSMHDQNLAPNNKSVISVIVGAPFKNKEYWKAKRNEIGKALIEKMRKIIPDIDKKIEVKLDATPNTLHRYTLNNKGAMCGWASTLKQVYENRINPETEIDGLYLTGHWATPHAGQGGIDVVIYSGKTTARLVVSNFKKRRQTVTV